MCKKNVKRGVIKNKLTTVVCTRISELLKLCGLVCENGEKNLWKHEGERIPHMSMNLLQGNMCLCVWSDVMFHKFSVSVFGPPVSTVSFCLCSSFYSYHTWAFNFICLLSLHQFSCVLIIALSSFSFHVLWNIPANSVEQIDLICLFCFVWRFTNMLKLCVLTTLVK